MAKPHWLVTFVVFSASSACIAADEWGDLKLRFSYDGEPPKPRLMKVAPDRLVPDESLIVEPKDLGIANVCVWLSTEDGASPPVHPDSAVAGNDKFAGTIRDGRFSPHIMIVRPPQGFLVRNHDHVGYDTNVEFSRNGSLGSTLKPDATFAVFLNREEDYPARLTCSIHPSRSGYVLVRSTPYSLVSDESGKVSFENLPVGKWTFVVWHERAGFVKQAARAGKVVEWPRGRATLEIKPGENDLGEIKLPPELFRR